MRRLIGFVFVTAILLSLISPVTHARMQSSMGTVTGSVTLTAARPAPLAASAYGRRGVATRKATAAPDIRNVVVYVDGLKTPGRPAALRTRIAQRDEQFMPQVSVVTTGSTVDFPNEDPFFHNVFSLSKAATFDLGRYPSGSSRERVFTKPGIVKVFCHLHSQMTALILVLDHPWFVIPSDDGTFTLPPVPAGDLTIVAWHERIGERREKIRVAAGGRASVSFSLPVLEPSQ
jgi:plastocyanin